MLHAADVIEIPSGLPATNWMAEQAIRPAVVTRKVCGGNRTWNGALAQEILASVLQTARQQQQDPIDLLVMMLRSPVPIVADVLLEPVAPALASPQRALTPAPG